MMIFIWWYFLSHPCQASSNAHKRGSIGHRAPFLILVKIEKKEIAFFLHKGIINIISMYICITFCTQIGFELKVYNNCFMWKGNLLYTDITFEIEKVSSLQTDLSPPSRPWPSPARRWAEREGAISPQLLRSPHKWLVIRFKKDKCVIRVCLCHCASMCWEGDSFIERDSVLFVFLVFLWLLS